MTFDLGVKVVTFDDHGVKVVTFDLGLGVKVTKNPKRKTSTFRF